jgi:hypothetical protein
LRKQPILPFRQISPIPFGVERQRSIFSTRSITAIWFAVSDNEIYIPASALIAIRFSGFVWVCCRSITLKESAHPSFSCGFCIHQLKHQHLKKTLQKHERIIAAHLPSV